MNDEIKVVGLFLSKSCQSFSHYIIARGQLCLMGWQARVLSMDSDWFLHSFEGLRELFLSLLSYNFLVYPDNSKIFTYDYGSLFLTPVLISWLSELVFKKYLADF